MTTQSFSATITVDKSPEEVFHAINNVRSWWQGTIEGSTDKQGDEFSYRMKDHHYSKQRITEIVPYKKIVWLVTDSKLNFEHETEWTGTKIIFDITEAGDKTQVRFTHDGLIPAFECYNGCSWAWGQLISQSLFSLISSGKGVDIFG